MNVKTSLNSVTNQAMKIKLADEQEYRRELCVDRTRIRRETARQLGKNSRPYRKMMAELRQEAR